MTDSALGAGGVAAGRQAPAARLNGHLERAPLGVRHAGEGGHALARAVHPRARPYTHAARVDRHVRGAGCAGFNLARVFQGRSTGCWACEGVILRCRWPGLRNGALAGTEGSIRARVAADARSSGTLLGGGRLVRSRWAEASGRPRQVAQAVVVIGTNAAEGETPSGRALGCVCGPCGAWDIPVGG